MLHKRFRRARLIGWGLLILLAVALPAWADDGAIDGVGGSYKLLDEHASIVMVKEKVMIDLSPTRADVDCLFTFHNDGPATTVKMGFPESAFGDVGQSGGFASFATWVDGKKATSQTTKLEDTGSGWRRWRVKSVSFAEDQTRLVRVRYQSGLGGDISGANSFEYVLATGASWKGPIGEVAVQLNVHDFPDYWSLGCSPSGYEQKGNVITWHWQNLEPGVAKDGSGFYGIMVSFFPGYDRIQLNDQALENRTNSGLYYQLEQGEVIAPLRALAEWTKGSLSWDSKTARGMLTAGGHKLLLQANQAQAELDGKVVILKTSPRLRQGRIYISANEIIGLLGGSSRFDKPSGVSYFTFGLPQEVSPD